MISLRLQLKKTKPYIDSTIVAVDEMKTYATNLAKSAYPSKVEEEESKATTIAETNAVADLKIE